SVIDKKCHHLKNKKVKKSLLFFILTVLGFISCKKEKADPPPKPAEIDVYVSGVSSNTVSEITAKYWKNGQPTSLSDGTKYAYAVSIAIVGSDLYAAGYE